MNLKTYLRLLKTIGSSSNSFLIQETAVGWKQCRWGITACTVGRSTVFQILIVSLFLPKPRNTDYILDASRDERTDPVLLRGERRGLLQRTSWPEELMVFCGKLRSMVFWHLHRCGGLWHVTSKIGVNHTLFSEVKWRLNLSYFCKTFWYNCIHLQN